MEVTKSIIINNFRKIEEYLEVDGINGAKIEYVYLDSNSHVDGVDKLVELIPNDLRPKKLNKFYKETGLKIQVERYINCDLKYIDRKGYYPRQFAYIWDEEFMKNVADHPEWLAPQEEPDIIIRLVVETDF